MIYVVECAKRIDLFISGVLKFCFKIREIYFVRNNFKITRNTLDLLENYSKNNFKFDYDFNSTLMKTEEFSLMHRISKEFFSLYIKNW
jgi:hypothetical protein